MRKYKTIIVKNRVLELEKDIDFINKNIDEYGNLFYIMNTQYDEFGNVEVDCFDILERFLEQGYFYKNILIFPVTEYQDVTFKDNVGYILWLSKDNKNNYFIKDPIREEHIWKNVEWGKRTKNYHEKGKDPGNVWIPTIDDGKGKITKHITLDTTEIIQRLIDMSNCDGNYKILEGTLNINQSNDNEKSVSEKTIDNDVNNYTIYFKTSENMIDLEDNSIGQAITSPPYWNLKDYFKEGQIGQESYEVYLDRLHKVFNATYAKLKKNGTLWININVRRKQGKVNLNPNDIIKICKEIGYYYKGIVIWHKSSGIPVGESNLVDRYEFVFIFSKNKNKKFETSILSEFDDYKNSSIGGKAFWNINRRAGSVGKGYEHPAIFPTELVNRTILLSSDKNESILDPFLGSGTTLIAAMENDRSFVGYEFNEEFKKLIDYRLTKEEVKEKELVKYI